MTRLIRTFALLTAVALLGCAQNYGDPVTPYDTPIDDPVLGGLRPASELSSYIGSWPDFPIDEEHRFTTATFLQAGDVAVDFTLQDLSGNSHRLAEYLQTKPVLLFIGSYSCPIYEAKIAEINALCEQPYDESSNFADRLHFVHVYVMEAHPMAPDPSPHYGTVYEDEFSTVRQPLDYATRQANAMLLAPRLASDQLLLLDDLRPHGADNPIWSSYGSGAASAWLIRQDGRIMAAHEWLDVTALRKSIQRLLVES